MTPNIEHFLGIRERTRQKRIAATKNKEQKKLRKTRFFDKLRKDEQVKRNEHRKKLGVYRTAGINMEDPEEYGGWVKSPPKKKSKQATDVVCKHCGLTGHSRTSSRQCLKHKPNNKPNVAAADAVPEADAKMIPTWMLPKTLMPMKPRHWKNTYKGMLLQMPMTPTTKQMTMNMTVRSKNSTCSLSTELNLNHLSYLIHSH
jgi:hypothetical protein